MKVFICEDSTFGKGGFKGKPLNLDEIKKCEEFCRRLDNENIKFSVLIGSPNLCAIRVGEFLGILEYV